MVMSESRQVAIVSDHFIFHDQGIQRGARWAEQFHELDVCHGHAYSPLR